MEMESIKTTLAELVESAGENGITEGQVVSEVVARHRMGYYEAIQALKSVYQDAGVERTPEHSGKVITYKAKKQEKQPEESAAKMAINSARRTAGERQQQDIISHYRR